MVNQMKYSSVLSPYMYAYIKEKEAVGHAVTQTKWFFHELDIYFQQNNLTSIQITKEIYDAGMSGHPSTVSVLRCMLRY